jgi:hypothetical protein
VEGGVMSAVIDVYRNEISMALSSGDDKWLATIARAFCERCHGYRSWKIVSVKAHACPLNGLQAQIGIQFDDGSDANVIVGYENGKRRLFLNGEDCGCDSSADVVHALQTPCAFFDGIYYAIEGLAGVVTSELKERILRFNEDYKQAHAKWKKECDSLNYVYGELSKTKVKLRNAEASLARALEAKALVGSPGSWSICPTDFDSRLLSATNFTTPDNCDPVTVHDAKKKLSGISGVYFGCRVTDGRIVYIGKAKDLGDRLHPRRQELIDCKIIYIKMPEEHIHHWELFYIWLHRPERNRETKEADALRARMNACA